MNVDGISDSRGVDPKDWVTIWQSEMAALAADRECHEALAAGALMWTSIYEPSGLRHDGSAGRAGSDAPPGTKAAGPVSGDGGEPGRDGDEIAGLRRRLAELERAAAHRGS